MAFPKKVTIREVGPREGMQIEPTDVSTADKIRMIDLLSTCQIPVMEVTSFVSPKWVPKMADAAEVAAGFTPNKSTRYEALYLNAKGIERAQATEKFELEGIIAITASETFSKKNTNLSIEETFADMDNRIQALQEYHIPLKTIAVMTAFGCLYEGDTDAHFVIRLIERSFEKATSYKLYPTQILLGDTVGWANPLAVEKLVGLIQEKWPEIDIVMHLHDTRGMGIVNAYTALKMGVQHFDASVGGLGGCPFSGSKGAAGNIATEDLVHMCHELGIETGIDLDQLIAVSEEIEQLLGRKLDSKVARGGDLARYRANMLNNV